MDYYSSRIKTPPKTPSEPGAAVNTAFNWRRDNAKSPRHHAAGENSSDATYASRRGRFGPLRSLTCRTYVHTPGRVLFFSFGMMVPGMSVLVRTKDARKRKHSTAQQQRKNDGNETEKFGNKKIPVPSRVKNSCRMGTPCTGPKEKKKKSNSRASLSASYAARPSRDHLATDSVRVKLSSLSATVSPVARLA